MSIRVHPKTVDKYQIIQPLGSGSSAQVYHAFDRALRAEKAIKILKVTDPKEFLASLEEAQILNKCNHKHIVTINEANIFDVDGQKRVILDLEYVPKGSLELALCNRWISVRDAVGYIRCALIGLEHAHSEGFLHRDIKPGNILLAGVAPKLSDFGLATQSDLDSTGSAQGYKTHLPPEFYKNFKTSQLTDVFAAGITLYRALSNISDWRAVVSSIPNVAQHIEKGTLISRIGIEKFIPTAIRRIINKACSAEPNKRYQTAHEFRQQLDKLRFDIDWIQISNYEWNGSDGSNIFHCNVDSVNKRLTVKRNNRRISKFCKKFNSLSEAIDGMHKHIANSTLC